MITKKTLFRNNLAKTLLIIIGIIVAIVLTINSNYLLSENSSFINPKETKQKSSKKVTKSDQNSEILSSAYKVAGFIYGYISSVKK